MKVLKFGAVWCPTCLIMKPRWKEIEEENPWLETEYFEYDEKLQEAEEYRVDKDIPVFVFLDKDNKEILRLKGEVSKKKILEVLSKYKDY